MAKPNVLVSVLHRRPLALAICFGGACLSGRAQSEVSLVDRTLQTVASALEGALEREADSAKLVAACDAARNYLDALGRATERRATELVIAHLERHKSGPFVLADDTATALFDEVRYQRTRGRPERMVPALLVLKTRYPDDARVLYALGEAYGIASPIFDAKRAEHNFTQLLKVLQEKTAVATEPVGRGRLLLQFLPELGRAGSLVGVPPVDTTVWLRQNVIGFCEKLRGGNPIGLWHLADPRLDNLYERLVRERRDLDQTKCREILEAMLEIQPINAVLQYLLAEVYASIGPEFDNEKAVSCLDEFLRLTDPAVLGGPDDHRPSIMTATAVTRNLRRFQLAKPRDDLEEQRIAARDLREMMKQRGVEGLLLVPDAKKVRSLVQSLERKITPKEGRLRRKRVSLDKNRRNLSRIPRTPAYRAKRAEFEQKIARQEKDSAKLEVEIEGMKSELDTLRALVGR